MSRFFAFVVGVFLLVRIAWASTGRWLKAACNGELEVDEAEIEPGCFLIANLKQPAKAKDSESKLNNLYRPGQKIYVGYPAKGCLSRLKVVGRYRGGGRLIGSYLAGTQLENWRSKIIYDPKVLRKLQKECTRWPGTENANTAAEWLSSADIKESKGYQTMPLEIQQLIWE